MGVLRMTRVVHAPSSAAWKVVADVEHYADYAPNLGSTHVTSGSGLGMTRTCSNLGGQSWSEECIDWHEGRRYSFRVDTSVYPYPMKTMVGTWELEDDQVVGTLIIMTFEYEMKYGLLGRIGGFVLRPWFRNIGNELLDNWQSAIEGEANAVSSTLHD